MGHCGVMHLPAPIRAAVGLVATAADEATHLPDRALELPMLAVSTALQVSLRAQQRYARLAAKGDEVLNRTGTTDEPPDWATFDEPISPEELRRTALAQLDDDGAEGAASRLFDQLFGTSDPSSGTPADDPQVAAAADPPERGLDNVTPIRKATSGAADDRPAGGSSAARPEQPGTTEPRTAPPEPPADAADPGAARNTGKQTAARKPPATKSTGKKAPAKQATAKQAPAKKTTAKQTAAKKAATKKAATKRSGASEPPSQATSDAGPDPAERRDTDGKSVSAPRHTRPSAFDAMGDSGESDDRSRGGD